MKRFKKVFAVLACVFLVGALAVPAFAADGDAASEAVSAMTSGFTQITSTISIGHILQVLTVVLGTAVGFFFFWWGIRKIIRVVSKSFKSGRVSV